MVDNKTMPHRPYDTPAMTETTVYHPSRSSPRPFHPRISTTSTPDLPPPPLAHLQSHRPKHLKSCSVDAPQSNRSPTSVSSRTTGSSSPSLRKSYPSPLSTPPYPPPSLALRGSMQSGLEEQAWHIPTRVHAGTSQDMSMGRPSTVDDNTAIYRYLQDEGEQAEEEDHAIWVLIFLSFLDPFLCLVSALYSLVVVLVLLVAFPMRFCRPSFSISTSTIHLIAPILRVHLNAICAPSAEDAYTLDFRPLTLILVQLVSPLLSIGVAVAAWIAAGFWLFALTMGNPDGTERRDDGRAAVLSVRNWWEKFLLAAAR